MRGGGRLRRLAVAVVVLVASALFSSGCSPAGDDALDVFAASSLRNAFVELGDAWQQHHDGDISVRLNFAGSSALREQLLDGAEADVFVSANEAIFAGLAADGLLDDESARPLTTNELVLVIPAANDAGFDGVADLADDAFFVGACSAGVPCGDLADRAVAQLADLDIDVTFDTREPDVSSLTRRVVDGELDAAFVYRSDLLAFATELVEIPLPEPSTTTYPIGVIADSDHAEAARSFVEFATGPEGQAVLARWGFGGSNAS